MDTITRLRTAGVLISDGHILLESLHNLDVWGVPGGGLEDGESLHEGCIREYAEELQLDVICTRTLFITENFWVNDPIPSQIRREYAFYFEVTPRQPFVTPKPHFVSAEGHLKFEWFPLTELGTLDFVPQFMIKPLTQLHNDEKPYPQMIFNNDGRVST